jgi:hypothetical protein
MSDNFRVPGVEYSLPSAREELNAEEGMLRRSPIDLATMVREQADALIEIAVRNGPRASVGDVLTWGWDPVVWEGHDDAHSHWGSASDYCAAARALGILK